MKIIFYCNGYKTLSLGFYADFTRCFDVKIFLILWTICIYKDCTMGQWTLLINNCYFNWLKNYIYIFYRVLFQQYLFLCLHQVRYIPSHRGGNIKTDLPTPLSPITFSPIIHQSITNYFNIGHISYSIAMRTMTQVE